VQKDRVMGLNTRFFLNTDSGEIGSEEITKSVTKRYNFTDSWKDVNPRLRMCPEPKEYLGKPDKNPAMAYGIRPFYEE